MNIKKLTLAITLIILIISLMVIPNKTMAATSLSSSVYFGIQEFRTNPSNAEVLAYAIGNPYDNKTARRRTCRC